MANLKRCNGHKTTKVFYNVDVNSHCPLCNPYERRNSISTNLKLQPLELGRGKGFRIKKSSRGPMKKFK
jgi:hypothetical protein